MPLKAIEALLENKIGLSSIAIGAKTIASAVERRRCFCCLQDVKAYRTYLDRNRDEWEKLIEEIVVTETWFFRHIQSFHFFSQYVLSELSPRLINKRIRILSIPCATGEEPYSLAMMLINAGIPCERFRIDALDIDGNEISFEATGIKAVIMQHEIDHLDGILFIDRISMLKRAMYKKKIKKALKNSEK